MAARTPPRRTETLTGSQSALVRVPEGVISGFLLKVIREQIPRTQDELAVDLGIDKSTVQGWESGRRPLSSTRAGNLVVLRRKLILLGAPTGLVDLISLAMDADFVLGEILRSRPTRAEVLRHPLAGWVLTRDTTHMIGWAISGVLPGAVAAELSIPAARRGPVSTAPLLGQDVRSCFFDNLRHTADVVEAGVRRPPFSGDRSATCPPTTGRAMWPSGSAGCGAEAGFPRPVRGGHPAGPKRGRSRQHWRDKGTPNCSGTSSPARSPTTMTSKPRT